MGAGSGLDYPNALGPEDLVEGTAVLRVTIPGQEPNAQENPARVDGTASTRSSNARIIGTLEAKPIVIGHSFGGLVVQRRSGRTSPRRRWRWMLQPITGVVYYHPRRCGSTPSR